MANFLIHPLCPNFSAGKATQIDSLDARVCFPFGAAIRHFRSGICVGYHV